MSTRQAERLYQTGCVLKDALRFDEAIDCLKQSMRESSDAELLKNVADQLVVLHDYAAGEEALKRALALSPCDGEAWHRLGKLLVRKGAESEALVAFGYAYRYKRAISYESALLESTKLFFSNYLQDLRISK